MDKMNFKVKNITHINDKGVDSQKLIKRILYDFCEDEEKWEGLSNKDIKELDTYVQEYPYFFDVKLEYGEYEGKERLKVFIKDIEDEWHNVGIVPPSIVKEYEEKKKDSIKTYIISAELTGGKIKKSVNYGESIETVELSYGIKITVGFTYENDIKKQETKIDNSFENKNYNVQEKIEKRNMENNERLIFPYIIVFIISSVVLIPFIWLVYKVFSFISSI